MSDSLASFQSKVRRHFSVLPTEVAVDRLRFLVLEGLRRVVLKSPVDTGRFRGNWQVGVGVVPASPEFRTEDPIGTGAAVVGAIRRLDKVVSLTNNVPYSERLEDGYSGQAPAGILGPTVAELAASVS